MKKILLSIAVLAGFTVSAQGEEPATNSEIAGNIQVSEGAGFELKFNTQGTLDHSVLNCMEIYDTFKAESATFSVDSTVDGNGFLKVSFDNFDTLSGNTRLGSNRLPVGQCGTANSGADGADISANAVIKARVRATTPVSLILTAATVDGGQWITHDASLTTQEIAGDAQWEIVEFAISDTAWNGAGNLEDLIGWEIWVAEGSELAAGEIHFDYITFGSSDFTVIIPCENEDAINDTTVVNYKNHEETPRTIALVDSNTFVTENNCYSTIRNYEYYCEEGIRRDTNFVVTSNISLSNYTQFELSQTIGQNRNGCDSMVYTYTSYIYCKPKETEETIIIKTVNSTIFDDETDLFSSSTYTTEEGCDSIHSVYRLFKHDPSSSDTIYETDTVYDIATDTVFIESTTCDTLVIDLSDVNNTEYLSSEFHLKVYPNPASELLYLDYRKPESFIDNLSLTIFDKLGRAVNQQQLTENSVSSVDLSEMAAGTYFITIYDSSFNKVAQAPFVINK